MVGESTRLNRIIHTPEVVRKCVVRSAYQNRLFSRYLLIRTLRLAVMSRDTKRRHMLKRRLLCLTVILLFSMSGFSQPRRRSSPRPASAQKQFKIFSECICGCSAKFISFIYDPDFRIDVSIGGCGHDPSVSFTKGGLEKQFTYHREPLERFVEKKSSQSVNAPLKKGLLEVYNLAVYCESNNVTKGTFSETGEYEPLARLRRLLKL